MTVTLTAGITRLEATIPVSADVASEYALIDSEVLRVRGHGTDALLTDRGALGSTPSVHSSGATVAPVAIATTATPGAQTGFDGTAGTGAASKAIVLDANGCWALGTDGSPFATTAARNILDVRVTSSATSGDTRTLYAKLFLSAAGSGEAGRFYATATGAGVAAGGTMNGVHVTANIHSGATISGQANAIRATIGTEDAASTPGGTLAAITAETNFYAGSTLPATACYQRFVTLASTVQPVTVFSFEGLGSTALASAGTGATSAGAVTGGVASKVLRFLIDGVAYWSPLFVSNS